MASKQKLDANQEGFVEDYRLTRDARAAAEHAGLAVIQRGFPFGFYVYGLIGDGGEIFYVGKGYRRRWMAHYRGTFGTDGNHAKRQAARASERRECVILASGLTEPDAFDVERIFIRALADGLTNLNLGGRSETERSKEAAEEMLSAAIPFDVWLALKPRPPAHVVMYHRIVAELRKVAEHGQQTCVTFRKIGDGPWGRVAS